MFSKKDSVNFNTNDVFNPTFQNTNLGDRLTDLFVGTSNKNIKNMLNQYEIQKATNINKFDWNKQGMLSAGINPLVASQGMGGNVSTTNQQLMNDGFDGMVGSVVNVLGKVALTALKKIRK